MQNTNAANRVDFSFLDKDEFRQKYSHGPEGSSIRFYVSGIRCGKCVRKLEDLPLSLAGLKELRVEMGKNLAHADTDPSILSFSGLAEKISELGFEPIPLSGELSEEDAQKIEDRNELIRLGVAGACAGNIMTFSFATYLGDTGSFHSLFSWLSFLLYLPVVTYVAKPFYIGAISSLREKQISIDLPMAVASLTGFVFSTVELLRGRDDIYFDSLSGFLFLILVSRWMQKRLQRKFLRAEEIAETFRLDRVRVVSEDGNWTWCPLESLSIGSKILLLAEETLPASCELLSTSAHFGMAWLSGEVKSKIFLQNSNIPAGARLDSGSAELEVKHLLKDTNFGKILQEVQRFGLAKNHMVSLADKWAQWLLGTIFAIAIIFLLSYWSTSTEEALRRSLALIILACPCAMAFGTPLALASALKKAQKRGLIVRNANAFENARNLKTIFFDKTGTLTETELSLVENPSAIPQIYQKIVLSLENQSVHPIAFAFRNAFTTNEALLDVDQFRETPGVGVSGYVYGRLYEIRSLLNSSDQIGCSLFEDKELKFQFTFEAKEKPDCMKVLNDLRARGYNLKLLSGDKKEVVTKLGRKLGFSTEETHFEMSPYEKAELVASTRNSMMVGDGVNDSLAMIRASVSVATSGGVEAALRSSDVYLTDPSLSGVTNLLDISQESFSLIKQNLLISLIYNLSGGALALAGYVNPMVAALLMPLSSGFILFSTWQRSHK